MKLPKIGLGPPPPKKKIIIHEPTPPWEKFLDPRIEICPTMYQRILLVSTVGVLPYTGLLVIRVWCYLSKVNNVISVRFFETKIVLAVVISRLVNTKIIVSANLLR